MERLPLYGQRILDLTTAWPGAYATRLLADMGAEVIRVETPSDDEPRSATFSRVHRNKYACIIDLARPRAHELFLRLVGLADVVVEDHRLGDIGLSYDALRSTKAGIVVVSLPDGGMVHADPLAGVAAAGAVGLALWHRRRTGEGQHVEITALETAIGLAGEVVVGRSMVGYTGHGHPSTSPSGCYLCAGGQSVAIAAEDDTQFAAFCRAMGRSELAGDSRFADIVSRYRNRDELDGIVREWTGQRTPQAVTGALQAAGVAAALVLDVPALLDDPHFRARGFWESVSHPDAGAWDIDGVPWRLNRSPAHIRLPAPRPGEHNEYVLRGLLGLSEEDVRELVEAGVVG